MHYILLSLSGS